MSARGARQERQGRRQQRGRRRAFENRHRLAAAAASLQKAPTICSQSNLERSSHRPRCAPAVQPVTYHDLSTYTQFKNKPNRNQLTSSSSQHPNSNTMTLNLALVWSSSSLNSFILLQCHTLEENKLIRALIIIRRVFCRGALVRLGWRGDHACATRRTIREGPRTCCGSSCA
jgi:hypothetical protein